MTEAVVHSPLLSTTILFRKVISIEQLPSAHNDQVKYYVLRHFVLTAVAASLIVIGTAACDSKEGHGSLSANAPSIATDTRGIVAESATQAGGEQTMAGEFFEVLLKWSPSGADPRVRDWLERQGLTAMPMKAGMLTVVSRGQIETSFGVSVEDVQPPVELPVPEELKPYLSAVTVLKPRSYH
jgi:hypothetical protein